MSEEESKIFDELFAEEVKVEKPPKVEEIKPPEEVKPPEEKPSEERPEVKPLLKAEETAPPAKEVYLLFSNKGEGKTFQAFGFPGTVVCLSFDRKAAIIKQNCYNNDGRIHIFDCIKLMDYTDQKTLTTSSVKTFEFLIEVLESAKALKPDWVVIDGSEIMQQVCEWTMRHRHDLEAFAGISNLNLWKERRMLIRQIHNKALDVSQKGVIYTTYITKDEIVVEGSLVTKKDVPKWVDVLVFETDFVLKLEFDSINNRHLVKCITSKNDHKLKTGKIFDVSGFKKLWEVV